MWINQLILAIIGISSGALVAGGLFGFIVSLGVVSDFADRTGTASKISLYEDAVALGAICGNFAYVYNIQFVHSSLLLGLFGVIAGIFVGCWAMALSEILNVFPIFVRRTKIIQAVPYLILSISIGKGIGAFIYFMMGW